MFLSFQSFSPAEHLLHFFGRHPKIFIKHIACLNRHFRHGPVASCSVQQQTAKSFEFLVCLHISDFITPAK